MRLYSNRGITLVESLVAVALLGFVAYTFASVFGIIGRGTQRAKASSLMVKLESSILSALESPDSFKNVNVQKGLQDGTLTEFELNFLGQKLARWKSGLETPLRFDVLSEEECSAALKPSCSIRVDFALRKTNVNPPHRWRFSYRISHDPTLKGSETPLKRLGAQSLGPNFLNNDFLADIPTHYYQKAESKSSCAEGFVMVGFELASGKAKCMKSLSEDDKCQNGYIAKGVRFVSEVAETTDEDQPLIVGKLELDCTTPMRRITCAGDNYGLHKFNPKYFDPTVPIDGALGNCKFLGVSWFPVNPDEKVFCPTQYSLSEDRTQCVLKPGVEDINSTPSCAAGFKIVGEAKKCEACDYEAEDCTKCPDSAEWDPEIKECVVPDEAI